MKKILLTLILSTVFWGQPICAETVGTNEQDAVFDNNYQTISTENKVDKTLSQIENLCFCKPK